MIKKIAISQSNYIPWKGYFDMINQVDEFVLYDEVQYTKRNWRNRNRIKTPQGLQWLTIPVSGGLSHRINEVKVADADWNKKHWKTIRHMYGQASKFKIYNDAVEELYLSADMSMLSDINHHFLAGINKLLEIDTPINWSTDYEIKRDDSERLISICKQANADVYVSGPAAKAYLDVDLFKSEGISVEWINYDGYEEYRQLHGDFEHAVTILDLLFNTGSDAIHYLKSTGKVGV